MSEVACPSCGTLNPEGFRFCGSCGSAMERTCPSCGSANPATNAFCGSCGTGLDAPPAAPALEERKVVSMLFADLTASTEMASRLDPEDLRAVLRPFFDTMVEEIDRYGGTVEKYIGDAIVAAFGAPVAHEDDPERAIRCALAMQRRVPELNDALAERAGGDLSLRIGINTGEVVAHSIEEGIVTGEAVNIAARFQSLAEPGHVVVGERTYRDAREAFAFSDLGEVSVKGVDRPLRVFAVDGESSPRDSFAGHETPFVGRGAEMELLRLLFSRTVDAARPNLVTIVGPPGIGKSRLSREVARTLEREGARVVRGRCLPYGDGLTYWPLAEILKTDAGILDSDAAATALAKARERLDPRFPGDEGIGVTSILLSSIGVELDSDPLAGAEPASAHRMIARAWQRYAEALASDVPLVALIEDLHWADPRLLDLLEAIMTRASGAILILIMARPELFERRSGWGGGGQNATAISLSPLSAGDGTTLIEHLLDGGAPAEIVGPILHRSEGNPFFASELLKMMIEDGTIARMPGGWTLVRSLPSALPDTVQGVIASRIDLLEPDEKRAIQDASVIGRIFWPGGIARLGTPDAERQVDGLLAKGLARSNEASSVEGERELLFAHVLIRDVAYASIPKARRAQAHAAVGSWIEEGTQGRADEFAEILAHHFSLAGDRARSARYALLAGQRLLRVFAADEAIAWFDRALEATDPSDALMRTEVSFSRGSAREQLGRYEEARSDYEDALRAAREAADVSAEARAFAAATHVLMLLDRYDECLERLPEALERAASAGLADVEARLLYTAGGLRFGRAEFAAAIPLHEQALSVARASGDVEGQAFAHHGLCETYFFQGPFESGLAHGEEADRLFRDLGQRQMIAHNAYMVAWLLGITGRPDEALAQVESSIETSHEIGSAREEGFALFQRSELHLAAGRLDAALADAERGTGIFVDLGLARGELVGHNVCNDAASESWMFDTIVDHADGALAISRDLPGTFQRSIALGYAAWGALLEGRRGEAEAFLDEARSLDEAFLDVAWSARAEVLVWEWARDPEALDRIGARISDRVLPTNAFWGCWGPYARGLSAQLRGDHVEALSRATTALEAASATGEVRLRWRAAALAARSLEALGRPDEAEPRREDAVAVVRQIAEGASGPLRDGFLARPDVAELLGSVRPR